MDKKLTPVGELKKGQTFRITPGGILFEKITNRGKIAIAHIRGDRSRNEFDKNFQVIPISFGGRKKAPVKIFRPVQLEIFS